MGGVLRDLTDAELRAAAPLKWALDGPDVLPAWVAEADFALAEPVHRAVRDYVGLGVLGYPAPASVRGVPQAFAGFAARRWEWEVNPERVALVGDVMHGMALVLDHLAEPGPVVVPTPVYPPFLALVRARRRELLPVPLASQDGRAVLDLDALAMAIRRGARTLLLCHPHNPVGRCWTATELEAVRDVVEPAGVRVVSDEIHAGLTHPGVRFTPYATVASPDAAVSTVTSATKAFSMPGARTALVISSQAADHEVLAALPPHTNVGLTTLGQVAAAAAFHEGEEWLDAAAERIAANHRSFRRLMTQALPTIALAPAEATYLAWLDVSALLGAQTDRQGLAREALAAGVRIDAQDYGPGGERHLRVNLATSPARVERIVARLGRAWARPVLTDGG